MTTSARGVIDLCDYAKSAKPTTDWIAGRAMPAFADPGATVAALAPAGTGAVAALPTDEFLIVLTGSLSIAGDQGAVHVASRQSTVLPANTRFRWKAAPNTTAIVVSCAGPASSPANILAIDESAALTPSNPPLASLLVGPTPACRNNTDFRSANGEFVCGTWDSTPYHRQAMPYRHIELMHLLEGSVTFEDADGGASTFNQGDIFVVTRGAVCAWISTVHVKKVYAIHRPA